MVAFDCSEVSFLVRDHLCAEAEVWPCTWAQPKKNEAKERCRRTAQAPGSPVRC